MDNDLKFPVGSRVTVADRPHPYGAAILAGPGTVLETRDPLARLRGDLVIRFDKGITGIFKLPADLPLISSL